MKSKFPCPNCITLAVCKASIKTAERNTADIINKNTRYNIFWFVLYQKCSLFRTFFESTEFLNLNNRDSILELFDLEERFK